MRTFTPVLALLVASGAACAGPGAAAMRATTGAPAPSPYVVRGVIDPGLNDLVLAAFLAPRGWQLHQGLRRSWQGAVPQPQLYVALVAPGGRSSIEFLPQVSYHFTAWVSPPPYWTDPVEHPPSPLEQYPLTPLTYLRYQLLPLLAQQVGKPIRLTRMQGDSVLPKTTLPPEATGYVEGVLPSGRRFRLTTSIQYRQSKEAAYTTYQWLALTTLVQSDTALPACVAYSQIALKSLAFNPAWQHQQQLLQQDGQLLGTAALRSGGARRELQPATSTLRLAAPPSPARTYQRQAFENIRPLQPEYSGPARHGADSASSSAMYRLASGQTIPINAPLATGQVAWAALQQHEAAHYLRPLPTLPGRRLMLVPLPILSPHERYLRHHY